MTSLFAPLGRPTGARALLTVRIHAARLLETDPAIGWKLLEEGTAMLCPYKSG